MVKGNIAIHETKELQIGCKSADSCIQSFVSDPLETQLGFWLLLIPEIPEKLGSAWDGNMSFFTCKTDGKGLIGLFRPTSKGAVFLPSKIQLTVHILPPPPINGDWVVEALGVFR